MFARGPERDGPRWYLELLNLVEHSAAAVTVVASCVEKSSDGEVEELLAGKEGWRTQLVGCVAVLAGDQRASQLEALVQACAAPSFVSPQLFVTASLVAAPKWVATATPGVTTRADTKAAAAITVLTDAASSTITELAQRDEQGGAPIAEHWRAGIRTAFDHAGLRHTW
jgi:hypothetical protein